MMFQSTLRLRADFVTNISHKLNVGKPNLASESKKDAKISASCVFDRIQLCGFAAVVQIELVGVFQNFAVAFVA